MRAARNAGFASVDAIVALTLLSITLAFCLQAGLAAQRAADMAGELRHAEALSRHVLAGAVQSPQSGASNGLDWRVDVVRDQSLAAKEPALCRRVFVAVNRTTGRRYDWQAVSPCARGSVVP